MDRRQSAIAETRCEAMFVDVFGDDPEVDGRQASFFG